MKEDNLFNVGDDTCDITVLHEKPIRRAKEQLMSENTYMELSETFKIFGNPTRLKILSLLSVEDLCVCDICEILNMSQSAVSHQLRTLRSKNLVKYTKEGKQARYSLADKHVVQILKIGIEHVLE
ncbi:MULTISPECIES: ArsR/SmtB family transcription factor [Methanosphaera]|uniref:Predicted transcriptional regulator n=2 Tax=Methanosphaera stadtmanae TaxID=2317 RepID=Q2NHU4_METST|nr:MULTISPECIES: metalloregulator ArsR/SmtB family transcription factor [Methanosphaera]ABC56539.1 predicted transcriptional regulator [Methanosphaera stadtmanae DSM 3091]MDO5822619.1 metalloregulator ArsR/SmtB family transcription factor [Methanosphaera sp.]MEE0489743.1 metalloregulator ArsR/SmtB family transcription factor [Methanosphaera stadtmanae]OEC90510.1 transcriptional repressor SmtB [Methanosphaera sp. A6]RAP03819.1 transcriptional regulator [Methanosphaera stadtmanae]